MYSIQELLYLWEGYGVFSFLLPFLLIFAVTFAAMDYVGLFRRNRGVSVVIAIVVGVMATRFPLFTEFYSELFPRLGIGITILLAVLILLGLFTTKWNKKNVVPWVFLAGGIVIALVVLYQTFEVLGWTYGGFGANIVGWVISLLLLLVILIVIVTGGSEGGRGESGEFVALVPRSGN